MQHYNPFGVRVWLYTTLLNAAILTFFAFAQPHWFLYLLGGMFVGYGYLASMALQNRIIQFRPAMIGLSILRMLTTSMLVVWIGHLDPGAAEPKIYETGIVIVGFLSYKLVLFIEYWRISRSRQKNKPVQT
jgi:hypothetical protein